MVLQTRRSDLGADLVAERGPRRREGADGLLTGGLGLADLRAITPPPGSSVRQMALHRDFRELMDVTDEGGFGRLHGPASLEALDVAGTETTALVRLPGRRFPFTVQVLIPDAFDRDDPCLIVAPSSGSRGVTGAVGDIGAWALTRGCALALTDKGTGVGAHLLASDEVYDLDGALTPAGGEPVSFAVRASGRVRRFVKEQPHAVALKHAHSREHVEADWPRFVLAAARYGLHRLEAAGLVPGRRRAQVIAAGVSNGGGAVLRAAEIDRRGILDGVVAAEPQITPAPRRSIAVIEGGEARPDPGRPLYDIASMMSLLAPVAACAPQFADLPLATLLEPLRPRQDDFAARLARAGVIDGDTLAARADAARAQIRALGFGPESDAVMNAMVALQIWPAVTVTFANALGRFGVEDALGGVTVAFADLGSPTPRAPSVEEKASLAGRSGGLAPGGGLALVDNGDAAWLSAETALAFRRLWTGSDGAAKRVRRGAQEVLASARPRGRPTILLHGRGDSLINPSHTSRAYMAAAARAGKAARGLRYYEIDPAQHFDTLLMTPGFSAHSVPLNPYLGDALSLMRETLRGGADLPPSQRVRATPPPPAADGTRARLEHGHLGAIARDPRPEDRIAVEPGRIVLASPR